MNLLPNELPPFIYRMRVLGYPPGWFADAEIKTSAITGNGLKRVGEFFLYFLESSWITTKSLTKGGQSLLSLSFL